MPKRRHNVEDVDEEVTTPSSKRARNSESNSDSEDQQGPSQTHWQTPVRHERAQGKRRAQETDVEDDERDKSKDEEMDDEQFESVYGEKLRVRLEEKRKTQGVSRLVN